MCNRHPGGIALAIVLAAVTWSASFSAMAQNQGRSYGPDMMYGPGYGRGMMGPAYGPGMMFGYSAAMMGNCGIGGDPDHQTSSFAEGRIAFLKAELNITDSQKTSWDAFADALKNNLQSRRDVWRSVRAAHETDSPLGRLDALIAAMETRLAALKAIKPALSTFYADLNAAQKKTADELLTGVGCMM